MNRIIFLVTAVLVASLMALSGEAYGQSGSNPNGQTGKAPSKPAAQERLSDADRCIKQTANALNELLNEFNRFNAPLGTPRSSKNCVGNANLCRAEFRYKQAQIDADTERLWANPPQFQIFLDPSVPVSKQCVDDVSQWSVSLWRSGLNQTRVQWGLAPLPRSHR